MSTHQLLANIRAILRSAETTAEGANLADLAYHISQGGKPEDYKPFDVSQPEKVAINAAGLYALVEAVGLFAYLNGKPDDDGYVEGIRFYAQLGDTLPESEGARQMVSVAMRFAHATWMASQPFRDMTTKPLGRLSRDVVNVFDALSWEEQVKDLKQIVSAAKWLAEKLNIDIA